MSDSPRRYIIGAYAGSPTLDRWDTAAETLYYEGLKAMTSVRGLEHPFYGSLHRDDDDWFLANIDPAWDYVITCIPGTLDRLKQNAAFGLASTGDVGRRQAIDFHEQARRAVRTLNGHLGRRAVIAVQLHSAPQQTKHGDSSALALAESLRELADRDWDGAAIVIEHVDAWVPQHAADKGFLRLEEEIEAIRLSDAPVRMTINWGRSAIEGRSVDTPVQHIDALRTAKLIAGVMFSGATAQDGAYGAWTDSHMPPAPPPGYTGVLPRESLMTTGEIARCLNAAGTVAYAGAKVMLWPKGAPLSARLDLVRDTIRILDDARHTPA